MDMLPKNEIQALTHETEQRIAELRQDIFAGLEELNKGKSVPGEQVFEELRRLSETRRGTTL